MARALQHFSIDVQNKAMSITATTTFFKQDTATIRERTAASTLFFSITIVFSRFVYLARLANCFVCSSSKRISSALISVNLLLRFSCTLLSFCDCSAICEETPCKAALMLLSALDFLLTCFSASVISISLARMSDLMLSLFSSLSAVSRALTSSSFSFFRLSSLSFAAFASFCAVSSFSLSSVELSVEPDFPATSAATEAALPRNENTAPMMSIVR